MTDPQTFYNREDLWNIAQETYGDDMQQMQAYYTTMRCLANRERSSRRSCRSPRLEPDRNNMLAWMVARSDGANYGQVSVYRFPQGKLVFGPQQIEARINQEPAISSQITLCSQQGSQVLRGNLLIFPRWARSCYTEPLYIQAQRNPLPELKRIIVASSKSRPGVVMSDRLDTALNALGQGRKGIVMARPPRRAPPRRLVALANRPPGGALADLAQQAFDHYTRAQAERSSKATGRRMARRWAKSEDSAPDERALSGLAERAGREQARPA